MKATNIQCPLYRVQHNNSNIVIQSTADYLQTCVFCYVSSFCFL